MNRSEANRAKRFLRDKFGDEISGNGIARLLEQYREWDGITNEDKNDKRLEELDIIRYVNERELTSHNRRREYVDKRSYMYKYLFENFGWSKTRIGRLFNRDHATIIHGLNNYKDQIGHVEYRKNVAELIARFRIKNEHSDIQKSIANNTSVLSKFNKEQYMKIHFTKVGNDLRTNEEALHLIIDNLDV